MLENVLDIDFESMRFSLAGSGGALILFDFEAAFPSISQEFLISMLTRLHLPSEVTNVVKALYHDCKCWIKMGGSVYEGFAMTSGV